jgi:hypothetical protein
MSENKPFNEDSLREMIAEQWGEHGAHIDVFDDLVKLAKGNIPAWLSDRADSEKNKEIRRRERMRNILVGLTLFVFEEGTEDDCQAYNALVEATREDITIEELEALRIEDMDTEVFKKAGDIFLSVGNQEKSVQELMDDPTILNNVHPFTKFIKVNQDYIDKDDKDFWWYAGTFIGIMAGTYTVREVGEKDDSIVKHLIDKGYTKEELFIVDNGDFMDKVILKEHCVKSK